MKVNTSGFRLRFYFIFLSFCITFLLLSRSYSKVFIHDKLNNHGYKDQKTDDVGKLVRVHTFEIHWMAFGIRKKKSQTHMAQDNEQGSQIMWPVVGYRGTSHLTARGPPALAPFCVLCATRLGLNRIA